MNPYETDPTLIPSTDSYADLPAYGRYKPKDEDFRPDPKHFMSTSAESLEYWSSVLDLCVESHIIVPGYEGGRDVFALGSVIVKSAHRDPDRDARRASRDHGMSDANEVAAVRLVREKLPEVRVPIIYFSGELRGCDVHIQERIPGVALCVAWRYLSADQKSSFKQQARELLRKLHQIQPPRGWTARAYLVPDADPIKHKGIQLLEHYLLFDEEDADQDLGFMHNDFNQSNCIVDDDRIVALVDWEMAGYFGWKRAGTVHAKIRCPQAEGFAHMGLKKEVLDDVLFWNDLYDVELDE